ncbi:hypothetical protein LK459_11660 [Gordonia otitidis]|uniref:hypothetical protein n=1 Tax=Gordonia otitidis TaxID=249058 RepID=UPI001D15D626|nr:hypothetical protein [Gordonia otitidis]UEA57304.1 hypothetical protein LK459_11660 [Gordonia otitidis]
MAVPSDAEIRSAAEQLGVLDENGDVPQSKRAQVAKALQLAARETRREQTFDTDTTRFARQIKRVHDALESEGVPTESADRVLGAVAPMVWREMKEKTAHDRTRD